MALFDQTRTYGRPASIADWAYTAVTKVVADVVAWNDARRTADSLSQLSAHELEDIGLNRGDIDEIANKRR